MDIQNKLQNTPLRQAWENIGISSHKGIDIPLSALHSKNSSGIGEFCDLSPLIDWCSSVGIDTIQLLPLNDSGFDPSPYNALSSLALHPIYLSLQHLPEIQSHKALSYKLDSLKKLNRFSSIHFQEVLKEKTAFLKEYFKKEEKRITSSQGFQDFFKKNPWVKAYSLFKVLKEKQNHTHFCLWPKEWKNLSEKDFDALFRQFLHECSFHIAMQYLCFLQLRSMKKKAEEKKVLLKGDIPILISPDSADVWALPEVFDLQISIGVPPDLYSKEGQYWGFPRPKWDVMRKDGFSWWKSRLSYASYFYDIYRIDHAVGLFRLWTIPVGRPSKEGHYEPGREPEWEALGKELLNLFINNSSMLPIAEDLGVIPPLVRPILEEFGICGTKVMRWEKNERGQFLDPKHYPEISLTCVSTHDSPTLEQWWKEESDAKDYAKEKGWEHLSKLSQEQRKIILKESLESASLFHINLFSEFLALIPELVWPDPNKERINIPGTILASNWTYKFRRPIEEITSHKVFKEEMEDLFKH